MRLIHSNTNSPSPYCWDYLKGSAAVGTGYVGGVESSEIYGIVASTIGGNLEIPTYDGLSVMMGNSGNGYAKITFISKL